MLAGLLETGYEPAQLLQPARCVVADAVHSVALIVEGDQGIACIATAGTIMGNYHQNCMVLEAWLIAMSAPYGNQGSSIMMQAQRCRHCVMVKPQQHGLKFKKAQRVVRSLWWPGQSAVINAHWW